MKDILQDVVAHTHSLGFLNLVKVTGDDANTQIESMAEDRSVILTADTKNPVCDTSLFEGLTTFSSTIQSRNITSLTSIS